MTLKKYDTVYLRFEPNIVKVFKEEIYVYGFVSMFGNVGGSLGLFFGLSLYGFLDTIMECFTNIYVKFAQEN